jgi:preprotein translocase subunit SecA
MAGRGTDIMLGGNVDYLADLELRERGLDPVETPEEYEAAWPEAVEAVKAKVAAEHDAVKEAGGLYVLGTERHESRRIDNQLRGRSGRQGDPGESRFYLSLGDDLMRLFNAGMVENFLTRVNMPDDVPIESKMVSNAIRSAQSQREAQNFEIRKNVLKYDDVINRQREVINAERRRVLEGADLEEQVRHMISDVVEGYVTAATNEGYAEDWDFDQLWTALRTLYPISKTVEELEAEAGGERSGLTSAFLINEIVADAHESYDRREAEVDALAGEGAMRDLERRVVLSVLDRKWREHLYEMDYLQEGIGLRAMAQRDPLVEYQREGFQLFEAMMDGIKEESVGYLFNLEVRAAEPGQEEPAATDTEVAELDDRELASVAAEMAGMAGGSEAAEEVVRHLAEDHPLVVAKGLDQPHRPTRLQYSSPSVDGDSGDGQRVHVETTDDEYAGVARNAPCPCGSGKKFKKCHGDPRLTSAN